jgi:hypothetical protein
MRWVDPPPPQIGDEKIVSWFAIRPVLINREWRWLERVSVKMRYTAGMFDNDWHWVGFVDPPKPEPKPKPTSTEANYTRKVRLDDE